MASTLCMGSGMELLVGCHTVLRVRVFLRSQSSRDCQHPYPDVIFRPNDPSRTHPGQDHFALSYRAKTWWRRNGCGLRSRGPQSGALTCTPGSSPPYPEAPECGRRVCLRMGESSRPSPSTHTSCFISPLESGSKVTTGKSLQYTSLTASASGFSTLRIFRV